MIDGQKVHVKKDFGPVGMYSFDLLYRNRVKNFNNNKSGRTAIYPGSSIMVIVPISDTVKSLIESKHATIRVDLRVFEIEDGNIVKDNVIRLKSAKNIRVNCNVNIGMTNSC